MPCEQKSGRRDAGVGRVAHAGNDATEIVEDPADGAAGRLWRLETAGSGTRQRDRLGRDRRVASSHWQQRRADGSRGQRACELRRRAGDGRGQTHRLGLGVAILPGHVDGHRLDSRGIRVEHTRAFVDRRIVDRSREPIHGIRGLASNLLVCSGHDVGVVGLAGVGAHETERAPALDGLLRQANRLGALLGDIPIEPQAAVDADVGHHAEGHHRQGDQGLHQRESALCAVPDDAHQKSLQLPGTWTKLPCVRRRRCSTSRS